MRFYFLQLPILLFIIFLGAEAKGADRLVLYKGDIFLCDILERAQDRYLVERDGITERIPQWTIKKIERGVDTLPPLVFGDILAGTTSTRLEGRSLPVESKSPAVTSHLELYSWRAHYWRQPERYLRGYLVNQSDTGYRRLAVQFQFLNAQDLVLWKINTEVFNAHPQTMLPFIIDTRQVVFARVEKIRVKALSRVKMKPGED
ncbi:hypothetical protein GF373_06555 [bacterium]|nr:hypothetical protein [bacterium]